MNEKLGGLAISHMMTSSNGNIFRVTDHLCGEFTGPGAQRPVTRSFDVFFELLLNKRFSTQSWGWWFETLSRPLWCHCNACMRRSGISSFDIIDIIINITEFVFGDVFPHTHKINKFIFLTNPGITHCYLVCMIDMNYDWYTPWGKWLWNSLRIHENSGQGMANMIREGTAMGLTWCTSAIVYDNNATKHLSKLHDKYSTESKNITILHDHWL